MPLRPKASSSTSPPTTGGSTSGSVTSARISPMPGSRTRASTQASGTPNSSDSTVAAVAHSSDSRSAVNEAEPDSSRSKPRHGIRISNANNGISRNARPSAAGAASSSGAPRGCCDRLLRAARTRPR